MELPSPLRASVDALLAGVPIPDLQRAADRLSSRYRAETRDGALHLDADLAVRAYLATRLPATYAAVRSSLEAMDALLPDFVPQTMLDVGTGPGTALWAAAECWPTLQQATALEASDAARAVGQRIAEALPLETRWLARNAIRPLTDVAPADLVTLAYVLDELPPAAILALIERLWALTAGCLVIVEPGTPAGWKRILTVREALLSAGAHLVAPCPHAAPCPLIQPDWCHFSRKVARAKTHRLVKRADVPWEEEKFIYVAASRSPAAERPARVLAPPRVNSGQVRLKLCLPEGDAAEQHFTKRHGEAFKAARRVDWGDVLPKP